MRKIICTIVAGSFLIAGAVKADETIVYEPAVNTGDLTAYYENVEVNEEDITEANHELVDFVDAIHSAIIDLTPSEKEKLRYLIEFVASKNAQLEFLLQQGQFDKATILLERYNEDVARINEWIENETLSHETDDITDKDNGIEGDELLIDTDIEEEVAERTSMRGVNLVALLERDDLPEQAKAGIRKALANQERAMENRQRAKERNELRKAERENKEVVEELEEEFVDLEDATAPKTEKVKEPKANQKPKNENAKKGQERAEQARENAKQKAEQGQKRGHEAKEQGQKRGHEAKQPGENRGQQAKENGPGNSNGKGNGNGNGGRP